MRNDKKLIWIGIGAVIVAMIFMQGIGKKTVAACGTCNSNADCNSGLQCRDITNGVECRLLAAPDQCYRPGLVCAASSSLAISCGATPTGCDGFPEGYVRCGGPGVVTQKCISGQWVIQQTCPYACFNDGSGAICLSSPCTSPNANIGQFSCRDGDVMKCTSTSIWTKINDCEGYLNYNSPCKNEKIARATETDAKNDCTAKTCNTAADISCDNCVSFTELLSYANAWVAKTGNPVPTFTNVLQAANAWIGRNKAMC